MIRASALKYLGNRVNKTGGILKKTKGTVSKGFGRGPKGRGKGGNQGANSWSPRGGKGGAYQKGGQGNQAIAIYTSPQGGSKGYSKGSGYQSKGSSKGSNWSDNRQDWQQSRNDSWETGSGKGGYSGGESMGSPRGSRGVNPLDRLTAEDKRLMKKITIVAQLDKVPRPPPAMQGMTLGNGRRSGGESGGLSSRFAANYQN